MRKPFILMAVLSASLVGLAAAAETTAPPEVTTADLEAAGYVSPVVLVQEGARYAPPARYFRVEDGAETTAKDCPDCGDLVAVFLGTTPTVPSWFTSHDDPLHLVGDRVQARRYHERTKTVIIVTGPDVGKVSSLSDRLLLRVAGDPVP